MREAAGYKHIGANSRSASLVSDTMSSLHANPKIRTPREIFKSNKPPQFARACVSAPGPRGDRRRRVSIDGQRYQSLASLSIAELKVVTGDISGQAREFQDP